MIFLVFANYAFGMTTHTVIVNTVVFAPVRKNLTMATLGVNRRAQLSSRNVNRIRFWDLIDLVNKIQSSNGTR